MLTDWLRAMGLRLRALLRPGEAERELEEEIRFHLEMEAERLERSGVPAAEARRLARVRFGGVERFKERTREARGTRWVEDGMNDLRYGLRMLARNPAFSLVAVATLGLGIGATTALYTVVEGVVLEPLPFPEPDELVALYSENVEENQLRSMTSPMDFDDWRNRNSTFQGMAAYWPASETLTEADGNAERLRAVFTTEDYFDVLGTSALLGRTFTEDDGPGSTEVLILSHEFWERRFGADPSVVGRTVSLEGDPKEVVGVLRPGQAWPVGTDVFINMTWPMRIQSRFARWMSALGRLEEPEALEAARDDMATVAAGIAEENPRTNRGWTVRVERIHEELVGDTGPVLWTLLAATAVTLLIACANVANLLLARSEVRAREMAVRTAFGAGRARLTRQLLVESLVLSGAGALVGVGLAWLGIRALPGLAPAGLPRQEAIGMDGSVLATVLAVSVLTGLLFGLAPVVRLALGDTRSAMAGGARSSAPVSARRLQGASVVGQVALALVLVAGAGLLVRSLANLRSVDPGFRSGGVLTAELDVPPSVAPTDTAVIEFYDQLLTRLGDLPGVEAVGDASSLPLATDHDYVQPFALERADLDPGLERRAAFRAVSPGFFAAMRTPVLEGRALGDGDRLGDAGVALVNEAFSRRFLSGESPVGERLVDIGYRFGPLGAVNIQDAEIVGVVRDIRYDGLRGEAGPAVYVSGLQSSLRRRTLVLRASGDPGDLLAGVRREVAALSSQVALTQVRTLDEVVADARAADRFGALLLSLFAAVALVLASVGVYGVLAYAVAQRTGELGIRMALGAGRGDLRAMVLGQGLRLVCLGLALGLAGTLLLSRALATQLYQVSPRDPRTLALVSAVLLAAGALASLIPAWRATRIDPVKAMRAE